MLPYIIGGAALGAAGFAGYHSIAWRSQVYGQTFIGTPGVGKKLALTFDDGPNDPHTLHLLDVLAKHGVKATFFLIGKFVQQRPDIVQRIVAEGHAIGNHTMTHPRLAISSAQSTLEEIALCESRIFVAKGGSSEETIHFHPSSCKNAQELRDFIMAARKWNGTTLFRPPFGLRRPATLRIARDLGYTPVMWTVTCWDWKKTTAERVEQHARRQITGGDVILMHDGGFEKMGADRAHSVIATDHLIREYKDKGFEFVTVPEMMKNSG